MKMEFKECTKQKANKGDVIILDDGRTYLVIEGNYSDEIMLVDLNTFDTTISGENLDEIINFSDVVRIVKSEHITMGEI